MKIWQLYTTGSALLLMLAGCHPSDSAVSASGVVYCAEGSPESFNPQLVTSGTTIDAISQHLYDRLLDIDASSGDLLPALATAWQVSADGLTYTFTLRSDVQFHQTAYFTPTRLMNASDVEFTFNRILDPNNPFHFVATEYPYFDSVGWRSLVKHVKALDNTHVEFALNQPDSSFLSTLATDFSAILSSEYASTLLKRQQTVALDELPVGTGPFLYREYQKDLLIRYYRHPHYWRGQVKAEQLVIDIVPDNTKRLAKILTHECDVAPIPRMAELKMLRQTKDFAIDEKTAMNVGYWAFNTKKPPFNDNRVRQALAHAVNRQNILQAVYFDQAVIAESVLPPTSWAYDPTSRAPNYDPETAKALLAQAGYPKGFSMDIWAMPVQRNYNPNAQKMAELIQADLAQVGVRARIVTYEWNTFRRKLKEFEHDSVLIGWSADNADPDNFFRPLFSCKAAQSGSNRANWCDPVFDEFLSQAVLTTDVAQRREYYQSAQRHFIEQMPLLPIAHSKRFLVRGSDVQGVHTNPYGGINFAAAEKKP